MSGRAVSGNDRKVDISANTQGADMQISLTMIASSVHDGKQSASSCITETDNRAKCSNHIRSSQARAQRAKCLVSTATFHEIQCPLLDVAFQFAAWD